MWKISTERADLILPHLREVPASFGVPCAVLRDLGEGCRFDAGELSGGLHEL